eukprot:2550394-Amphidinium_carterae.2
MCIRDRANKVMWHDTGGDRTNDSAKIEATNIQRSSRKNLHRHSPIKTSVSILTTFEQTRSSSLLPSLTVLLGLQSINLETFGTEAVAKLGGSNQSVLF